MQPFFQQLFQPRTAPPELTRFSRHQFASRAQLAPAPPSRTDCFPLNKWPRVHAAKTRESIAPQRSKFLIPGLIAKNCRRAAGEQKKMFCDTHTHLFLTKRALTKLTMTKRVHPFCFLFVPLLPCCRWANTSVSRINYGASHFGRRTPNAVIKVCVRMFCVVCALKSAMLKPTPSCNTQSEQLFWLAPFLTLLLFHLKHSFQDAVLIL